MWDSTFGNLWTAISFKLSCNSLCKFSFHLTLDQTVALPLKGKLGISLFAQSFYWPQTKRSLNRQFSPKSPKVGQKSGQSVKNWPNIKAPSCIRPTVGIHQFCHQSCRGNPSIPSSDLLWESTFWQFQHLTYCGNPPIPSSELLWESIRQNWWIPTIGRMQEGAYLVNFWHFDLIFGQLWGFSVKIAYWDFS